MKLTHYHNACVKVETSTKSILCDPWFSSAYYGTWKPARKFDNPIQTIGPVEYIWISHIHPDHYDPEFLLQYQSVYNSPVIAPDPFVKAACKLHGVEFVDRPPTLSFESIVVQSAVYQ